MPVGGGVYLCFGFQLQQKMAFNMGKIDQNNSKKPPPKNAINFF